VSGFGWEYHYRKRGIYGGLSIPAFLGMSAGAFQLGGWIGLIGFVAFAAVLTWKAKGFNALDKFGSVVQPMFVLCLVAAVGWSLIKRLL
jgi:hypothetical protein